MPDFHVNWEGEVVAPDPWDAAREALNQIKRPGSMSYVFTVTNEDGESFHVDLYELAQLACCSCGTFGCHCVINDEPYCHACFQKQFKQCADCKDYMSVDEGEVCDECRGISAAIKSTFLTITPTITLTRSGREALYNHSVEQACSIIRKIAFEQMESGQSKEQDVAILTLGEAEHYLKHGRFSRQRDAIKQSYGVTPE